MNVFAQNLIQPVLRAAVRAGAALEPIYGGAHQVDGQRLDPELHAVLAAAKAAGLGGIERMEVPAARAYSARMLRLFDAAPMPVSRVVHTAAPGPAGPIPVRVYEPYAPRPAWLVYFHGGGGVIGSLDTYDVVARLIASRTGCTVAMIEYRLAPEHPYPHPIEDAVAAWRWACERASSNRVKRVGVAGDSFGGYLSAWVERRTRSDGLPRPAMQALIYPLVDLTMSSPSVDLFADGYLLTKTLMEWFRGHYAPDPATRREASPIFLDHLAGAPLSLVVTAGFDPLRDEGRAYADRLAIGGAEVHYRCEHDLVHGFLGMSGAFRRCAEAVAQLCDEIAASLAD
jgi:acetyl esterase